MTTTTPPAPPILTIRSVIAGFFLSLLMCGVNSFLTLSFGVIEEGPTIAALFFFAIFFMFPRKITSTEMVIVATMGSAGGSLGFISNFYAAKVMTGAAYTISEMASFAIITSLLGMLFVIPLRELLVLRENLPWPGSKAVASVISALVESGDRKQPLYLLIASVIALVVVVGNTEDGFQWWPDSTALNIFGLGAFGAGIAWSPFATGGSYLMGMRTCVGFLMGGIILLIMAPHLPDPSSPHRYVWPGMGFLLSTGLTMMLLNWKVMTDGLRSIVKLKGGLPDPDAILSPRHLAIFAAVTLTITSLFCYFVLGLNVLLIFVLIVVGAGIQNVIATRASAVTAFNPARAMGVLLEGVCALLGGRASHINLAGAGFVAGSGAQAGPMTGDFVYGRSFGVPARWQFWTQFITIVPCSFVSAWVFDRIHASKTISLDGGNVAAPVAKMWAASSLIFEGKTQMPPFAMEAIGIGALIGVLYVLLEEKSPLAKWLPSSTGIGIGLVISPMLDFAFFLGGFVMWIVLGKWLKVRDITLTTIAVACIVAEGIGGVLKPLLQLAGIITPPG